MKGSFLLLLAMALLLCSCHKGLYIPITKGSTNGTDSVKTKVRTMTLFKVDRFYKKTKYILIDSAYQLYLIGDSRKNAENPFRLQNSYTNSISFGRWNDAEKIMERILLVVNAEGLVTKGSFSNECLNCLTSGMEFNVEMKRLRCCTNENHNENRHCGNTIGEMADFSKKHGCIF